MDTPRAGQGKNLVYSKPGLSQISRFTFGTKQEYINSCLYFDLTWNISYADKL